MYPYPQVGSYMKAVAKTPRKSLAGMISHRGKLGNNNILRIDAKAKKLHERTKKFEVVEHKAATSFEHDHY